MEPNKALGYDFERDRRRVRRTIALMLVPPVAIAIAVALWMQRRNERARAEAATFRPDLSCIAPAQGQGPPAPGQGEVLFAGKGQPTRQRANDLADRFIAAIAAGTPDKAYSMMSQRYRDVVTEKRFSDVVRKNPYLKPGFGTNVWTYGKWDSGPVQHLDVAVTRSGEPKLEYHVDLIQDTDGWSVLGLGIGGVQMIPTIADSLLAK